MAKNNDLVVTAGLNIQASVDQIEKDLKKVADQLNSDQALKIACGIDVKNINVKEMQQSLNAVAQKADLKLDIKSTLDKEVVTRDIDAIKKAFQLSVASIGSKTDFRNAFKPMLQEFRDAYTAMNTEELEKSFDKIIEFIKKTARESIVLDNTFKELKQSLQDAIAFEGRISIDKPTYGDLKSMYGGATDSVLNQVFGKKNWEHSSSKNRLSHSGFDTVIDSLNKLQGTNIEYNNLAEGIASIYEVISKPVPKGTILDVVPSLQALFDELATGLGLPNGSYDVTNFGQIFSGDEEVLKKLADALEQVKQETIAIAQAAKEVKYPQIAIGGSTKDTLVNAKETLNQFFDTEGIDGEANRVKRAIEDTSGELQRFYVQVERGDKSIETLTYALNEQGNAYEYLGKTIREADNSTDFRRKDITTQWDIQTQKLQQFITNAEKAGAASTVLSDDIANLKSKLDSKGDTSAMNAFLDEFDIAKAKFQAFKAEVGKDNALETLRNRIAKTSAALEDYANKNSKAVTSNKLMSDGVSTFAEKWQELTTRLNSAEVRESPELFKHLNEEIATFKKEADAAGLTISAFFRNMRTQLSYVIMQWVSIQGAIRIVKSMVTEVRDLDNAMINLKKVTDETDDTYRKFTASAQKQATELHTTTTAVVEQTAEWAKLGFTIDEAQQLSKISSIYAKVGEVDNATAVSDLVTVLKAFNQTADESIKTVDALNKLGNTFATDAKSLGEGISVSASALAMAGNDLNQSLAMLTGGTEITQNARETGNAIKVISLRIRGELYASV